MKKMNKLNEIMRCNPVVTCVGTDYVIFVPVNTNVLMKIRVGEKYYFNHCNGVRISDTRLQKFTVPMAELNRSRSYCVIYSEVTVREAYSCKTGEEFSKEYLFRPIEKTESLNIYIVSDAHGLFKPVVDAASYFHNKPDLLILNGDISSSSDDAERVLLQFDIAAAITEGESPCIITRGNHDLRGEYAEKLGEYLPTRNGKTYYSVKIGCFWFLILDCGEDKPDSHREYSETVCCHEMRLDETEYIHDVINIKVKEYASPDIMHKIVICHVPFEFNNTSYCKGERPFDIEHEIFGEWCSLIRNEIKPDFMICGHMHVSEIWRNGKNDDKKIGVPVIIGGVPGKKYGFSDCYTGCALTVNRHNAKAVFNDNKGNCFGEADIVFK